jgi:hypothetical protein
MAIAFELSVNVGSDEAVATQFCQAIKRNYRTFAIEGYQIDLHEPLVLPFHDLAKQPSYSVSILPKAVGHGVGLDNRQSRIPLNSLQLSELGRRLYDLLQGINGYQIALVGWDTDWINLADLHEEWVEDISEGRLTGLVVARKVRPQLPNSEHFVPFDDKHDWIPYQGSNAIE